MFSFLYKLIADRDLIIGDPVLFIAHLIGIRVGTAENLLMSGDLTYIGSMKEVVLTFINIINTGEKTPKTERFTISTEEKLKEAAKKYSNLDALIPDTKLNLLINTIDLFLRFLSFSIMTR